MPSGNPLPGFTSPTQCAAAGDFANAPYDPTNPTGGGYNPLLAPYDLTRGGGYYTFNGHTDVKELGLYAEDQITAGNWTIMAGIRGDLYNGLAIQRQAEPRVGVAYTIKKTNTVLRTSYARTLETPFNENLVLSSQGCGSAVLAELAHLHSRRLHHPPARLPQRVPRRPATGHRQPLRPLRRLHLEVHPQRLRLLRPGQHPHHLPHRLAQLQNPRLRPPRRTCPTTTASPPSSSCRRSPRASSRPQIAGAGATVARAAIPSASTTTRSTTRPPTCQYQIPGKFSPWYSFNWRYDSGLVAGATPCYNVNDPNSLCNPVNNGAPSPSTASPALISPALPPTRSLKAGIACNGVKATPYSGFTQCLASQYTSSLLSIPAPNQENDDHDPQRVAPRSLFDMAIGQDNLFNGDKYKWSLHLTAINVTNKYALYNFLSTFSGTHYVTPRALTAELGFHF